MKVYLVNLWLGRHQLITDECNKEQIKINDMLEHITEDLITFMGKYADHRNRQNRMYVLVLLASVLTATVRLVDDITALAELIAADRLEPHSECCKLFGIIQTSVLP